MFIPCRLALTALLVFCASPAFAHPHEWIDVQVTIVLDAQRNITALRQTWLFDDYYSALSLPDFDANANGEWDAPELQKLASSNLSNLKEFGYFTTLAAGNGKPMALVDAREIGAAMQGTRIAMRFTLPLAAPIPANGFTYSIYDPSYYVAMLAAKEKPVTFENAPAVPCTYTINRPEPGATWVALAAGLDRNAVAPDDLGRYFAEHVGITCE